MTKVYKTFQEKTGKKVILTELERQQIVNDIDIDAAAILLNTQTGHEWVIYGRQNIREKLDEQKIEVFTGTDIVNGEEKAVQWREHTNVYEIVKMIKGDVLRKKPQELTLEERIMGELGMSLEEAKEKLGKSSEVDEEKEALIQKAKDLKIQGNLNAMKTDTLLKKINEATSLESRIEE